MNSIGIRELRQRASEFLRRVEAGETIEVTDRGRPIALLSPIPQASPLDRLRSTGQVQEATASLSDLPDPVEIGQGQQSASDTLERLRDDER